MFRFVALFALVAVAAAEPESDSDALTPYHHGQEAHMKTVTGDTASVAAAKDDHFQMKAAEYAKKGYAAPYAYGSFPYQTYGYPYHHLGKRDAEAESDAWYYNTNVAHAEYPQFYNRFYNGVYNGVYGARAGVYNAYPTNVYGAGVYGAYPYTQYSQFQQRF